MSRIISFLVLIAIILVIGFFFFRVMSPFLLPLFLAVLLVVIFHPLHLRVLQRCQGKHRLASATTTGLIILIVLLPLLAVIFIAAAEGSAMIARLNPSELRDKVGHARDKFALLRMPHAELIRQIEARIQILAAESTNAQFASGEPSEIAAILTDLTRLRTLEKVTTAETGPRFDAVNQALVKAEKETGGGTPSTAYRDALRAAASEFHELKVELLGGEFRTWIKELANPTEEVLQHNLRRFLAETKGWLFSVGGRTTAMAGKIVVGLIIMIVATFFFLAEGPMMVATIMRLSPLDDRYERELLADFSNVSRAVVVATLLSALIQGLLGGIGYTLAGFHSIVLMTMLTGLLAMVPFVGAAAVWLPAALWLYFVEERTGAAVLLAIYGFAVVSSIDNLIKPLVLHGRSRLHPLLALLSVLGGVNVLGPIGILIGPMLVAFLQTLLNILHRELMQFDLERRGGGSHVAENI
ncbi:MAG: AI-2E family transporter [Pirellulaceae bacterium]